MPPKWPNSSHFGAKPASLGSAGAIVSLAAGLVHHGLDVVELRGVAEAAEYVAQCLGGVLKDFFPKSPTNFPLKSSCYCTFRSNYLSTKLDRGRRHRFWSGCCSELSYKRFKKST